MEKTKLIYHSDTYAFTTLAQVQEAGQDEKGTYLILDQTIYYPGGGGQPKDIAFIECSNTFQTNIIGADFNNGWVKHYVDNQKMFTKGMQISIKVEQQMRLLYSAYHTGGHWLASLITECMQIPYVPLKGYHYTDGAYVEFEGDKKLLTDEHLEDIRFSMRIDLQSNPKILTEIISIHDTEKLKKANVPANFVPMPDKPLRLVTIEGYAPVPCGGTHVRQLRDIRSVLPKKVAVKNGKTRLYYHCEMYYPMFV